MRPNAALAERDLAAALAHAEGAVGLDRFSERAQRLRMLTLYALGRTHEALDRYRDYRVSLAEELGLEPTSDTRAVEAAVIRPGGRFLAPPRPIERVRARIRTSGPFASSGGMPSWRR